MNVQWHDEFATGVRLLDSQNKNLINKIDKLSKAVSYGRGKLEVSQLVPFLEEYTKMHFSVEEKYMSDYNYPEISFHKNQHRKFKKTFEELKREFSKTSFNSDSIKYFQYEIWKFYEEHISVIDTELAKFLRRKGAQ